MSQNQKKYIFFSQKNFPPNIAGCLQMRVLSAPKMLFQPHGPRRISFCYKTLRNLITWLILQIEDNLMK